MKKTKILAACAGMLAVGAHADVTVQEQTTFNLSVIKANTTMTELTTADKQRRDTVIHCDGFMSIFCGNAQSGEITRLDRGVRWTLEPKKQEYRETPFMTAAEREAAMQEAQAAIDKLKQCPASPQAAPGPNTSKCQMSPPKFDATQTDTHASILGHDARMSQLTMTQSCTNPDTGDTCDFQIALESWLTQEEIAGLEDKRAFQQAYLRKMGLDEAGTAMVQNQMRQFLAPYAESLKQLAGKAGDFKGYPMRTVVRIAFGGPHCAAAQQQQQNASGGGDAASAPQSSPGYSGGTSLGSVASNLGGKLVGGLFAKKKQDQAAAPAPEQSPLPPGMIQAAQFTTETTAITPGPIAPAQFDIPPGWKLIPPPAKGAPKEVTCPKTG